MAEGEGTAPKETFPDENRQARRRVARGAKAVTKRGARTAVAEAEPEEEGQTVIDIDPSALPQPAPNGDAAPMGDGLVIDGQMMPVLVLVKGPTGVQPILKGVTAYEAQTVLELGLKELRKQLGL